MLLNVILVLDQFQFVWHIPIVVANTNITVPKDRDVVCLRAKRVCLNRSNTIPLPLEPLLWGARRLASAALLNDSRDLWHWHPMRRLDIWLFVLGSEVALAADNFRAIPT